jgi:hypothetical protein
MNRRPKEAQHEHPSQPEADHCRGAPVGRVTLLDELAAEQPSRQTVEPPDFKGFGACLQGDSAE